MPFDFLLSKLWPSVQKLPYIVIHVVKAIIVNRRALFRHNECLFSISIEYFEHDVNRHKKQLQ